MSSKNSEANTIYSMETQGEAYQHKTRCRMSRHMTFEITRAQLNDYPPLYPYITN